MSRYSLSHLSDGAVLSGLKTLVARDRATTAEILAHIAEVDERRLYAPAGFPSMHAYCVGELRLSEDAARKRIHAARTARRVPAVFTAVAEGRVHLSAVVLLAPCLTPENARELLAAATHKSKLEIEQLVAEWSPRLEEPTVVGAIVEPLTPPAPFHSERAPGRVESSATNAVAPQPSSQRPRVEPISPQRYFLQLTMSQEMHDKLRHAQALLGHQIPSGDEAKVLERALDALIHKLEKRKFAATDRPGRPRSSKNPRHIAADVRRTVRERDGFQCTFVSESGRRCPATTMLEFDHVVPVARGGKATAENLRLRCRAHNQHAAESAFGADFMKRRRKAAQEAAARARATERAAEVIPWLRALGIRADQARYAAQRCETIPDAPLEERVKLALRSFAPRSQPPSRTLPVSIGTGP